jgi:hypothetical protein
MTPTRCRVRGCALLGILWLLLGGPASASPDSGEPRPLEPGTYQYTLAGRIRLLLFWIGRADVGVGRFVRSEHENGRTVELMVGMDPERAPRRANRWGYTREELRGTETRIVVAGTDYEAESLEDVQQRLDREIAVAVGVMRARVTSDAAVVRTTALEVERETTFRDIESVLARAPEDHDHWRTRRIARPENVRPGFLMALVELIDHTVAAHQREPASSNSFRGVRIPYVYSDRIYDMTLRRRRFDREARFRGRTYHNVLHGQFEARNQKTGERNRFAVSFGTEGALAGVPVRIVLRPRWWVEAELLLDQEGSPDPVPTASGS